ncbi:HIT family protein [Alcaligenaceae bacterium]|nr:HIT family protein [Alcaligenaceae bacterium]
MAPASSNCPLCRAIGGTLLWRGLQLRVIAADDAAHPGLTRVVWQDHVSEMTDLAPAQRDTLMAAVWLVEQVQRQVLQPDKINLAQFGNMAPHLHWHIIPRWTDDSHFPEAIWASAPARPEPADQAWQIHKKNIHALLPRYYAELAAALNASRINANGTDSFRRSD